MCASLETLTIAAYVFGVFSSGLVGEVAGVSPVCPQRGECPRVCVGMSELESHVYEEAQHH